VEDNGPKEMLTPFGISIQAVLRRKQRGQRKIRIAPKRLKILADFRAREFKLP
jgi:hypothetical protein